MNTATQTKTAAISLSATRPNLSTILARFVMLQAMAVAALWLVWGN